MLILARKDRVHADSEDNQVIDLICPDFTIRVMLVEVCNGGSARIGIQAPRCVQIVRPDAKKDEQGKPTHVA